MKPLARALLLVAAGAAAVLLGAELWMRAAGYEAPRWYRPDPRRGWALRPQVSGWFNGEGRSFVQVNSAGQRDREHPLDKPEGVYRVAVLGDAFSEAMQLPLEQAYWAQLPARLEECGFRPGKRIEVLNFGVRDYGTAQAYLTLESVALRYRPDLVLLQFTNGNDVRDNSRALDGKQTRPYFRLEADGTLRLDDSFASSPTHRRQSAHGRALFVALTDHSRLLQVASRARLDLMRDAHARTEAGEVALEPGALTPPQDSRWAEAWQVTEALIAKIGELASRHGAAVAVVAVPFAMEVHPDRAWRERLQARYGVADFAYPDRRVTSFARHKRMHAVLLAPEMKAIAEASGAPLYGYENRRVGFGHWNPAGHRAAAQIIARSLCANPAW